MQRFLLSAVLVVLALLAVFLWDREGARSDRGAEPGGLAAPMPRSDAVELASPISASQGGPRAEPAAQRPRESAATIAAPTVVATTWTGVRVRVTAFEDGRSLSGVRIRPSTPDRGGPSTDIEGPHARPGEVPITGADGIAELELVAGIAYRIDVWSAVSSAGRESVTLDRPLAPGEVRELAIALRTEPDLELHGRVIDRETRAPIVGARVGGRDGWERSAPEDSTVTDVDGRFRVVGRSWIDTITHVTAAGYARTWLTVVAGHATPETALEITLSRAASVRLTVRDAAGRPIEGGTAMLSVPESQLTTSQALGVLMIADARSDATFKATTDAHGLAVIADLPPRVPLAGELLRRGVETFRAPEPLTLAPGEMREVEWRIGGGCTIEGIALELDGRPVAALSIGLESTFGAAGATYFRPTSTGDRRLAQTDAAGRFAFADVGPGSWRVGPTPARGRQSGPVAPDAVAPLAQLVVIEPGAAHTAVEIRVDRGLTIEGTVLDPDGNPIEDGYVHFQRTDDRASGSGRMEGSRFVLGPLAEGPHELIAMLPTQFVPSNSVFAPAGARDVVLRLRKGAMLRGVLIDARTGAPVEADVELFGSRSEQGRWSLPERNGSFDAGGLAPDTYDVVATTSGGLVGRARAVVEAGLTHDIRIELAPGARLRVRFEGPWPVGTINVMSGEACLVSDGLERGTEKTFVVSAGTLIARIRDSQGGSDFDLPVTAKVGETSDLVFDGAWK